MRINELVYATRCSERRTGGRHVVAADRTHDPCLAELLVQIKAEAPSHTIWLLRCWPERERVDGQLFGTEKGARDEAEGVRTTEAAPAKGRTGNGREARKVTEERWARRLRRVLWAALVPRGGTLVRRWRMPARTAHPGTQASRAWRPHDCRFASCAWTRARAPSRSELPTVALRSRHARHTRQHWTGSFQSDLTRDELDGLFERTGYSSLE
ncbi:uncharacterized protein C8Q71DRAFT_780695 [Rhodofomes roseus]|uniref:Transposase n=1 Tax=Rhodofomes roseus TaxID=34475 RepID=A0ABQ8K4L9_9APHY|nr:uncharacterized protein C8Q71DRAFT_780695 [Rhodofomes roseus]KAH9831833.1 hypothetical protein C8Q71DRAFT_780695 [Rhodofomes roseus]